MGSSVAVFAGTADQAGFGIDAFGHRAAFGILMALPIAGAVALAITRPLPVLVPAENANAKGVFDLLRHPRLLQLFLINAVVSLGWDIHTIFLPIYGTEIGLSSAEIGMALSSLAAATFVVRVTIGRIARRYSERQILMCALMLIAVTLPLLPLTRDPVVLIVLSFLIGLGLGTGQPMVMSLLHAHAPPGRLGGSGGRSHLAHPIDERSGPAGVRRRRVVRRGASRLLAGGNLRGRGQYRREAIARGKIAAAGHPVG